jgi:hypothetical protein
MPALDRTQNEFLKIEMAMFDIVETYRRENIALKEMLLKRGLTRRQLRKEMSVLLKHPEPRSAADQQFRELREGMKVFLERYPVNQALLAKIPVSGTRQ